MTFDADSSSNDDRPSNANDEAPSQSHPNANQQSASSETSPAREDSTKAANPDNYVMAVVDKTKKTASFLWLLLHAKSCQHGDKCTYRGCVETTRLLQHMKSCPTAGSCQQCPEKYNGCQQARKLLGHYRQCREIRTKQLRLNRLKHTCLLCTMLERHDRAMKESCTIASTTLNGNEERNIDMTQTSQDMNVEVKDKSTKTLSRSFSEQMMPPPPPRPRTYSMGSASLLQSNTTASRRVLPLPEKNMLYKSKPAAFESKSSCGRKAGRLRARSFDERTRRILGDHDTNNEPSIEFILSNLKHSRESITEREMQGGLRGLGSSQKGRSASVGGYVPVSNGTCESIMEE